MSKLLMILVIGFLPISDPPIDVIEENVELVETNHYFDESGRHIFDQVLFYDWSESSQRFDVRAYRLIKRPGLLPIQDASDRYLSLWQDGDYLRLVTAKQRLETWTQHDPELLERALLPKNRRLELATPLDVPKRR